MYFSNIKNKKFELLFIHEVTKKNIYADKSSLTLQEKNNTIPYAKIDKNTGKNLTFFEIFWKIQQKSIFFIHLSSKPNLIYNFYGQIQIQHTKIRKKYFHSRTNEISLISFLVHHFEMESSCSIFRKNGSNLQEKKY